MKFRWQFEDEYKITVEADNADLLARALMENSGPLRESIERDLRLILEALESGKVPEEEKDVVDELRTRRERASR